MSRTELALFVAEATNYSDGSLADAIGQLNADLKDLEAHLKALKDEMKSRNRQLIVGKEYEVTATDQVSSILDTEAVKEFLGNRVQRFLKDRMSTVIRVKAKVRSVEAA